MKAWFKAISLIYAKLSFWNIYFINNSFWEAQNAHKHIYNVASFWIKIMLMFTSSLPEGLKDKQRCSEEAVGGEQNSDSKSRKSDTTLTFYSKDLHW